MIDIAKRKTADNDINDINYSVADIFDSRSDNITVGDVMAINVLNDR